MAAKSGADEVFDDHKGVVHHFESETVSSSLFENTAIEKAVSRTFQINRKYIVNPIKSGIVIINQYRAHQRVLYEQFLEQMTIQKGMSQQLLFPLTLFFSREQLQVFDEIKKPLQLVGFVFDESNVDHLVISGLPINITESDANAVIEQLISDLQNGFSNESFSQNDSIAKSMARSLAVRNGISLSETAQENLVNNLFGCREPNFSPFQKPTFITMNVDDIDKKFNL
jgi:DNA mismatch repair protein MutL